MSERQEEIKLEGGNVTPVVKVGNTVRRIPGPWSETVHGLLNHLEEQGFDGAPRFLGFDEQGREILTFIEGIVGNYPLPDYMWQDSTLVEVAQLLHRFHELTRTYRPVDANWENSYPDSQRHEVICHNDFAPYNMVFEAEKPKAMIDFDLAGPGPRVWDLAYAVYRFIPLSWDEGIQSLGLAETTQQVRRLALFCQAYGLEDWGELLPMVAKRIEFMIESLANGAANGNAAYQKMIDEGHLAYYQKELATFRRHQPTLAKFLKVQ